jgi:hypothetical protein
MNTKLPTQATIPPPSGGRGALFAYFSNVKDQIIATATQKGMSAKALASMQIAETENGYTLKANGGIHFTEPDHRRPAQPGAAATNPDLPAIIADWLDARGLNINPHAAASTIHKNQVRLSRPSGNKQVLSVPLNTDRLDQVFDSIGDEYLQSASEQIFDLM